MLQLWLGLVEYGQRVGKSFEPDDTPLEEFGFVNVRNKSYVIPIGSWPKSRTMKKRGSWAELYFLEMLEALASRPLRSLGWSPEEVQVLLAYVRKELKDTNLYVIL